MRQFGIITGSEKGFQIRTRLDGKGRPSHGSGRDENEGRKVARDGPERAGPFRQNFTENVPFPLIFSLENVTGPDGTDDFQPPFL